jgi:hypothetical protein
MAIYGLFFSHQEQVEKGEGKATEGDIMSKAISRKLNVLYIFNNTQHYMVCVLRLNSDKDNNKANF